MLGSIGKQLGLALAELEEELYRGNLDLEVLQKVAAVSEACRNLSQSGLSGFIAEFEAGYRDGVKIALEDEKNEPLPDKRTLWGDYLSPE